METMDIGSWFIQSSLSFYGDDHVLDDKSKYKVLCFNDNYMAAIYPKTHSWTVTLDTTSLAWTVTPPRHTFAFLPPNKG
jgi:hypothetical protein